MAFVLKFKQNEIKVHYVKLVSIVIRGNKTNGDENVDGDYGSSRTMKISRHLVIRRKS